MTRPGALPDGAPGGDDAPAPLALRARSDAPAWLDAPTHDGCWMLRRAGRPDVTMRIVTDRGATRCLPPFGEGRSPQDFGEGALWLPVAVAPYEKSILPETDLGALWDPGRGAREHARTRAALALLGMSPERQAQRRAALVTALVEHGLPVRPVRQ